MAEAGKKIKELSVADTLNETDELIVEDATPKTKRTTLQKLYAWVEKQVLEAVKLITDELQKSIESAQKTISDIQKKVGTGSKVGEIPAYNNSSHSVGITFATLKDSSIIRAVIDGNGYDLIPNNKGVTNNYKIVDVATEIVDSGWRLTFKIYVDGTIYTKYIDLK